MNVIVFIGNRVFNKTWGSIIMIYKIYDNECRRVLSMVRIKRMKVFKGMQKFNFYEEIRVH